MWSHPAVSYFIVIVLPLLARHKNKHDLRRQCEFGRACLQRLLEGKSAPIKYFGLVKEKFHADIVSALESQVYNHWDSDSSLSPSKTRPPTQRKLEVEKLGLEIIAMQNNQPIFPLDVLLNRFPSGAAEQEQIKEMKLEFERTFPAVAPSQSESPGRPLDRRASGQCDFSIDNGAKPLDVNRDLDVATVPLDECPAGRPVL